jgi:hypothetical protein
MLRASPFAVDEDTPSAFAAFPETLHRASKTPVASCFVVFATRTFAFTVLSAKFG